MPSTTTTTTTTTTPAPSFKAMLSDVIMAKSIPDENLLAIYDWEKPNVTSEISIEAQIDSIIINSKIIANSKHSITNHMMSLPTGISMIPDASAMMGFSIGAQNNILTHDNKGTFIDDVFYIPKSGSLQDWTVFFDLEIELSQDKSVSTFLITNKKDPTDTAGFSVLLNGLNFLAFEFENQNGNKDTKTFLKPLPAGAGEKCLIAVSRSASSNLISFFVYDPIKKETFEQGFLAEEKISTNNWCVGGTFNNFSSSAEYKKFSGEINNLLLFSGALSKDQISYIFRSFHFSSFTREHTKEVIELVPGPGQYAEIEIQDPNEPLKVDRKEVVKQEIEAADGSKIIFYDKTSVWTKNMIKTVQYVNTDELIEKSNTVTVPESEETDLDYAKTYFTQKCLLLDVSVDTSKYTEVYSCDQDFDNVGKKATFMVGDSTFSPAAAEDFSDENIVQVYNNGNLLILGDDYVIDNEKIKGSFVANDELIYDIYPCDKLYLDFFGYLGDIYLYDMNGRDAFLNGEKLIKDLDYEDYFIPVPGSAPLGYLKIMADVSDRWPNGLPEGKLGLVERYDNVTQISNFKEKHLNCLSFPIANEIIWIDGKRTSKEGSYSLTSAGNLNNSENLAPTKKIKIYNNEATFFTYS